MPERQASDFLTETLNAHPQGRDAAQILAAALNSVEPGAAVLRFLQRRKSQLQAGTAVYDLDAYARIWLIGFGKASIPMAEAVRETLAERLQAGLIITKYGHAAGHTLPETVRIFEAGHPVPDEAGAAAAREMIRLLQPLGPQDLVICVVSGGGSALLAAPAAGVTLDELQTINSQLLASGADIHEINTVRKHLSAVKGGQLARYAAPADMLTLVLSDVVGDSLDIIASGPTVPDPASYHDAIQVLEKYALRAPAYLREGQAGRHPETPKPGERLFENSHHVLVGSNRIAAEAAAQEALRLGYRATIQTTALVGEAARKAVDFVRHPGRKQPRTVQIAGGETTVTLGERFGKGGRNQEAALAVVEELTGDSLFIAIATDGGDGPTNAAGAVVSGATAQKANALGLDPGTFLKAHNAYAFFEALGDLIRIGPTQTNVNDLWLLLR